MFVQVKTPINLKKDRSRAHKRKHIFLLTNVRSYPLGLPGAGLDGVGSGETQDCTPCPSTGKGALGSTSRESLTSGAPEAGEVLTQP